MSLKSGAQEVGRVQGVASFNGPEDEVVVVGAPEMVATGVSVGILAEPWYNVVCESG